MGQVVLGLEQRDGTERGQPGGGADAGDAAADDQKILHGCLRVWRQSATGAGQAKGARSGF